MKTKLTMGRKLIAWILTLAMVITFIPMTGNVAYADTATIETDKTVYEVGEPVMVRSTGYTGGNADWVAIYSANDTDTMIEGTQVTSYFWHYPDGGFWNFFDYDCNNRDGMNNYLPEGNYRVVLLTTGGSGYIIKAETEIEIVTPENNGKLTTDKTEYTVGESVRVTANYTNDSDWVALYEAGKGPWTNGAYAAYWYPKTEGKPFEISNLGVGEYTLYFLENDGYNVLDCAQISVKEAVTEPEQPTIEYTNDTIEDHYVVDDLKNEWGVTLATNKYEYEVGESVYLKAFFNGEYDAPTDMYIGIYDNNNTNTVGSTTPLYKVYTGDNTWADVTDFIICGENMNAKVTDNTNGEGLKAGNTYYVIASGPDGRYGVLPIKIKGEPEPEVNPYEDYKIALVPEDTLPNAVDFGNGIMVDATYTQGYPAGFEAEITIPEGVTPESTMWIGIYPHDWDVDANQSLAWKYVSGDVGKTVDFAKGWTIQDQNGMSIGGYRKVVLFAHENKVNGKYVIADTAYYYVRPDASDAKVNLSATEFTYNGQVQAPEVTSVDGYNSIWYDVEIPENTVNVGTYTVKAKFHGNVGGTATAEYTINPKAITADMVAEIADQDYTGEALTPEVVVTDGETVLESGKDFDVVYTDNTAEGTAKVTVTAKGNYTGEVTVEFGIACKHDLTPVDAVDATCTTDGNVAHFVCGICEAYFLDEAAEKATTAEEVVIDALGHEMTPVEAADPTCDKAGNNPYFICGNCEGLFEDEAGEYTTTAEDVVLPATGEHDLTKVEAVAATCEKDGNIEYFVCGTCEGLFVIEDGEYVAVTAEDVVSPKLGHKYVGTVTTEPTCTKEGVKTFVCENDAKHTYTEPVNATGHTMTAVAAVAATCETAGNTAHFICDTCKGYFEDEAGEKATTAEAVAVKALGHKYDAGTVTKAATCTEDGVKTFVCQNDAKHTKTEAVKATGHKYAEAVTAPTCTEQGYTTYTCVCGHTYKDAVTEALGHTVVVDEAVAPTYTATGLTEGTHCSVCETVLTAQEEVAGLVPAAAKNVKVNLRTVNGGYDDIKATWNKVTGATAYKVFWKKAAAKKWNVATVKTNSFVRNNLDDGVKYQVKVVAVGKFGESKDSAVVNVTTLKKLAAPKVTKSGAKVKVKWNNINGETGYQISRAAKKGGTNVIATVKTTTGVSKIVKANKGKKYFYKVRAYKVVNGTKVFGPWSAVKAFKR